MFDFHVLFSDVEVADDGVPGGRRLDYLLGVLDARPGSTYGSAEFAADLALQGQWVTVGDVERMRITGHRLDDPVMLAAIEAAAHVPPAYFSDSRWRRA